MLVSQIAPFEIGAVGHNVRKTRRMQRLLYSQHQRLNSEKFRQALSMLSLSRKFEARAIALQANASYKPKDAPKQTKKTKKKSLEAAHIFPRSKLVVSTRVNFISNIGAQILVWDA